MCVWSVRVMLIVCFIQSLWNGSVHCWINHLLTMDLKECVRSSLMLHIKYVSSHFKIKHKWRWRTGLGCIENCLLSVFVLWYLGENDHSRWIWVWKDKDLCQITRDDFHNWRVVRTESESRGYNHSHNNWVLRVSCDFGVWLQNMCFFGLRQT
jgi:hypothetical protein